MTLAKESTTFHQKVHALGDLNISHPVDVRPPRRPHGQRLARARALAYRVGPG